MFDFEKELASSLDHLAPSRVKQAMLYSLCSPAKRIRPRLLFALLEAYGQEPQIGLNCAIGIEMIHTYSLIHDDLPAMDDDDMRRGQLTCHKAFDEASAILAGDGLLTQAFEYASKASDCSEINVEIVLAFVRMAGANGMILGQEIDLNVENKQLDLATCTQLDSLKTGCLLSLPLICGALLCNKKEDVEKWQTIGTKLGIAFQMQDDYLERHASSEQLGKSLSDVRNQKQTLLSLMGEEKGRLVMQQLYEEIKALLSTMNLDSSALNSILDQLIHRKS